MATGNFCTQKNFPLIVATDATIREYLGREEFEVLEYFDYSIYIEELKMHLYDLNRETELFDIEVESGYYEGLQLWVVPKHYGCETVEEYIDFMMENIEHYEDEEEYLNDIAYYTDEFEKDFKILHDNMEKIKELMNMVEFKVAARFSNGETIYTEVKP
mgnify:CR=1 FL=1